MNEININAPFGAKNYTVTPSAQGKKSKTDDINSNEPSDVVNVTLSEEAQEFLNDIPGKSVAKRARAALAQEGFEALSNIPFGKVVSTLARGIDLSTLLPEPVVVEEQPEETEDVTPTEDAAPAEEASVVVTEGDPAETILGDAEIALSLLTPLDTEAA